MGIWDITCKFCTSPNVMDMFHRYVQQKTRFTCSFQCDFSTFWRKKAIFHLENRSRAASGKLSRPGYPTSEVVVSFSPGRMIQFDEQIS